MFALRPRDQSRALKSRGNLRWCSPASSASTSQTSLSFPTFFVSPLSALMFTLCLFHPFTIHFCHLFSSSILLLPLSYKLFFFSGVPFSPPLTSSSFPFYLSLPLSSSSYAPFIALQLHQITDGRQCDSLINTVLNQSQQHVSRAALSCPRRASRPLQICSLRQAGALGRERSGDEECRVNARWGDHPSRLLPRCRWQ